MHSALTGVQVLVTSTPEHAHWLAHFCWGLLIYDRNIVLGCSFIDAFYASRKILGEHIVVGLSVCPSIRQSFRTYVPNSCPALNFVIWSRILQLFHRNDHHIETTCCAQHLGHYLEGHGHSMTLQQNLVRTITSLFEVRFHNYFSEMITILRRRVARNIWVTAWPCSKIVSGP
jgi:hypothetical protein